MRLFCSLTRPTLFALLSWLSLAATAQATPSCACAQMEVLCAPTNVIQTVCGENALACARNKKTDGASCTVALDQESCALLGLDYLLAPQAIERFDDLNCSQYLNSGHDTPENALKKALACCTLKHEIGHLQDPLCKHGPKAHPLCHESKTYAISEECSSEVAETFCALHKDNPKYSQGCSQSCHTTLISRARSIYAACACDDGSSAPGRDCARECEQNLNVVDRPSECLGESTAYSASYSAVAICNQVAQESGDAQLKSLARSVAIP